MKFSSRYLVVHLLLIASVLGACSGLNRSDEPANKTWWLQPYTGMVQMAFPTAVLPVAVDVTVVPGLDTNRILTLADNAQLNHYAAARWVDNTPELLTSLTSRTLLATGRFQVEPGRSMRRAEGCRLQLEVKEFFATITASGQTTSVQVAADGKYLCGPGSPIAITLGAAVPVADESMTGIVAAFQQALDEVMEDLLNQL